MARSGKQGQKRAKFERIFEELSANINESAKAALEQGARMVVADAKNRVRNISGKLSDSISYKLQKNGLRAIIKAPATNEDGLAYGQYVEFWPGRKRPFLYPAMDAQREAIKELLIAAIKEGVHK